MADFVSLALVEHMSKQDEYFMPPCTGQADKAVLVRTLSPKCNEKLQIAYHRVKYFDVN